MSRPHADPSAVLTLLSLVPPEKLRKLAVLLLLGGSGCNSGTDTPEPRSVPQPAGRRSRSRKQRVDKGMKRGPRQTLASKVATPPAAVPASITAAADAARKRDNAKRKARRVAAKLRANGSANGHAKPDSESTVARLWAKAAAMDPARPWHVLVAEFGVSEGAARDAYRGRNLPSGVGPDEVNRFLGLQAK